MRSQWFGCGGLIALTTCACLAWSADARAQSNASFPEPAAPPPAAAPTAPPPPPSAFTPPATPSPAPVAPAPYTPPAAVPYTPPAPALPAYQPSSDSLRFLPPLLPYKKGLPVPPGYRVVDRSASGLTIGGGLTFLAAYIAGLGLAASQSFDNGTAYTAIPVVGPFAAIGGRTFKCKVGISATMLTAKDAQKAINKCVGVAFDEVTSVVFLTADGLVQATGAVIFFIGLASGYQELVRKDLPKAAVYPLPEGGAAFSLTGRF